MVIQCVEYLHKVILANIYFLGTLPPKISRTYATSGVVDFLIFNKTDTKVHCLWCDAKVDKQL